MEINIVPFTEDYLGGVMEIELTSFVTPWSVYAFEHILTDLRSHYIVAVDPSGKVVGYGGVYILLDEANLDSIAVSAGMRGEGIGRLLLENLIAISKKEKAATLMLEVRVTNTAAINLYKSTSFKETGIRKNYYTKPVEDALLLTLYL